MGQYFVLVNQEKREYVCPYCIGGVAKLWEWAANTTQAGMIPLLIRQSDEGGGGDYRYLAKHPVVGSWAGDRITLVGDYDSSELYEKARRSYTNVSQEIAKAWNEEVGRADLKVTARPCGCDQRCY